MKKNLLLFMMAVLSFGAIAQDRIVTGKVTSTEDGSPLPGVNVVLKGTAVGTATDADGKYSLNIPSSGGSLVFSFIGLESKEIIIGDRSVVDISLALDATELSEVVITAFGVAQEKKALGYQVQDVKGDQLVTSRDQNIMNQLQGKIAGAQITSASGGVGSSTRVVLRGASSITGNNEPLYVVDGIPISNRATGNAGSGGGSDFGNGAGDINPDDVESITVLGPNAAGLYGSRASNGVILITTKSGKGTKGIGISVNTSMQFERPFRLPDFQNSYGQGASNTFFEFVDGANGSEAVDESWGMPLDIGLEAVQFTSNGQYAEPWVSHPDNVKNFFETGVLSTMNISISGANEKGNFRFSATNLEQTGTLPNTDLSRKTFALNAGYNLTSKLSTDFSANYIIGHSDNRPVTGYNGRNPIQQFIWSGRQVDFEALKDYKNLPISTSGPGAGITPLNWNTRFQNNPYWQAYNVTNGNHRDRLIGNFRINYKFNDWLSMFVRSGVDFFAENQVRIAAVGDNNSTNAKGLFQEYFETNFEANTDFLLTARKELSSDFVLGGSFGGNRRDQTFQNLNGTAPQLELPGVYNVSNVASGVNPTTGNFKNQKRVNSLYGTVDLAYKNYVFLNVMARNDWSSTLPVNANSYFYPGVSLSATVSDIFQIQSETLSYLKVRGSWVQVGSDTDPYALQQTFAFGSPFGSVLTPTVNNTLLNPSLKPEITTSTEVGVEANLWSGRLNVTATLYKKNTTDQIIPVQISESSGYQFRNTNVGEMENKGLELQIGGTPVKLNNGFAWDINLVWARNISEVVKLAPGLETIVLGGQWNVSTEARVGQPYGTIFGPAYVKDPKGNIVHQNGLPVIDETYQVLGNFTPQWTGGITNNFSYKGINLNIVIDGRYGGDVYSMTTSWGRYAGVLEETLLGRETGIVGKGVIDNGDGTFRPNDVVVTAEQYNKGAYSNDVAESSVFDGTFLKLRQVQLGYRLPNKVMGKLPFRDVTFSVVGRNLALLYATIPHIDPETSFSSSNANQGLEFGQIPTNRSIGFNLSFKM